MTIVAERFEHVVGIDTHARSHTYCLLDCTSGVIIDTACSPTSEAGNARAISWIVRRTKGDVLAAVEGTSSYGAGITAALVQEGFVVAEVPPAARSSHAHEGKSDVLDAETAARFVLRRDYNQLARPRASRRRAALRALLASRSIIDQQRTANRNALNALLRSIDLGIDARKAVSDQQIRTIAAWRIRRATVKCDPLVIARREARRLATAVLEQTDALQENHHQLQLLAQELAPGLQEQPGIGPVTASIIVCAYSHHRRIRSEPAFAALGGITPLPASSGNTNRHRLSRSGDRQLNRTFNVIVRNHMSYDPTTHEIQHCLKRYVRRSTFRELQTRMT